MPKNYSLYRLVLVAFLALFLIDVALVYFTAREHRQDLFQAAIEEKMKLAETIKETVASPSWLYRMSILQDLEKGLIAGFSHFEGVSFIRIVKSSGQVYQSTFTEEIGQQIIDPEINRVLESNKPLVRDEVFQGQQLKVIIYPGYENQTIWVGFSLSQTRALTERLFWRYLLFAALIFVFLVAVLVFILKNIVNPIRDMTVACEDVGKGKLDVRLNVKQPTEIGVLAETFNRMLKDLADSRSNLEEAKTALEIRMRARTRELQDTQEARLRAETEKNKTQTIITSLVDGLLFFSPDNRLRLMNPVAERFLGVASTLVIGKNLANLKETAALQSLAEFIGRNKAPLVKQELSLTKNLVVEISIIQTKRDGFEMGSLVILHDVTREKIVERLKSEFVSLAAHQLRTPLSAIKWSLKMLLEGDLGKVKPEQTEMIEKTYQSNEKMITLINDLLNVTRIEEGRFVINPAPVEMEKICHASIEMLQGALKMKNLKFSFLKEKGKDFRVAVDEEKMTMAVQNLIDNAIKYTPKGGKITLSLEEASDGVKLTVQDTGIGIASEDQNRVFTKFFRSKKAVSAEPAGTGLGLYMVRNIIESHGGRIWFDSKTGRGTSFYVFLPLYEQGKSTSFLVA